MSKQQAQNKVKNMILDPRNTDLGDIGVKLLAAAKK